MGNKPNPPNPAQSQAAAREMASEQMGYNQQAQFGSQYNQYNPFGGLQYVIGPDGRPTALSSFSPEQAPLWAQQLMSKGIAGGQGTSLLGGANYGFGGQPADVIGNSASGITGDIIKGQMDFLKPFQTTQREQLDTKLKNQGLEPGTPAYDNAMRGLDTNQSLAAGKIIGDASPFAYKQASDMYTMPLMMANALSSMGMPINPNQMFGATPGLQPPNLTGAFQANQQAAMDQYNAQMAQYSGQQQGIANGAGALMALALM